MIYFSLSNLLQIQYDGLLMKLKGNFVSKEIYLLKDDMLTALGRPYSVCVSLKDAGVSEERAYEQWNGIEEIEGSDLPLIYEGTLMGELMRYLLMRMRKILNVKPYADEHMLAVLRGKLNDKLKYYDVSLERSDTLVSDIRFMGVPCAAETVLKIISEPSILEENLKDIDLVYARRLMGLCRYEEAALIYEDAIGRTRTDSIIGTELAMCLAETYYFLDRCEDSAALYLKCDGRYIRDIEDYKLRLGHALLRVGEPREEQIRIYYKGSLNPTFRKYNMDEYEDAAASVEPLYDTYKELCMKEAEKVLSGKVAESTGSSGVNKTRKVIKKVSKLC